MGDQLIMIGVAMACASSAVFHWRLFQLREELIEKFPEICKSLKLNESGRNPVLIYNRLMSIPLKFHSNNQALNEKLTALKWLYLSSAVGLVVVLSGVIITIAAA